MEGICRIALFGSPQVTVMGRTTTRFRTQKTAWLLAWLASSDQPLQRARVAEELWPETDPETARKSLTVALSSLRRILEPVDVPRGTVLQTFRDTCSLTPDSFTTDLQDLQRLIAEQNLPQLLTNFKTIGDVESNLLQDIDLDWADQLRRDTADQIADFAATALPDLANEKDWTSTVTLARTWLAIDPYADLPATHLVQALLAQNRRTEAATFARKYRSFVLQALRRDVSTTFAKATEPLKTQPADFPENPEDALGQKSWGTKTIVHSKKWKRMPSQFQADDLGGTGAFSSVHDAVTYAKELQSKRIPSAILTAEVNSLTDWSNARSTANDLLAQVKAQEIVCSRSTATLLNWDKDPGDMVSLTPADQAQETFLITTAPTVRPLPQHPTKFFGRHQEQTDILSLLNQKSTRLVTITGIGGMGKTRLALQVINQTDNPQNTPFVSFRNADPDRGAALYTADALGIQADTPEEATNLIKQNLANKQAIVLFDNCETAPTDFTSWLDGLLIQLPDLKALVTSRLPVSLPYEQEFRLTPLPVPKPSDPVAELSQNPSVQLFSDRARVRNSDFSLTENNKEQVAAICDAVEGVPLALELAASRVGSLSLKRIQTSLSDRLAFLKKPAHHQPDRQDSVRSVIAWSLDRADATRRPLLSALGLFAQTGTEQELQKILNLETEDEALDLLLEAQDLSLVTLHEDPWGNTRFSMLSVIQEFLETRPAQDNAKTRFIKTYLALAESIAARFADPDQADAQDRMHADYWNFLKALRLAEKDPKHYQDALLIGEALWRHWDIRCHASEGLRHLARVLTLETPPSLAKSTIHMRYSHLLTRNTDNLTEAARHNAIAVELREKLGTPINIASAYGQRAQLLRNLERFDEAIDLYHRIGKIFEEEGMELTVAINLSNLGGCYREMGDPEKAEEHYLQSLEIRHRLQDHRGIASSSLQYALVLEDLNRIPEATNLAHRAMDASLEVFDVSLVPLAAGLLCRYLAPDNQKTAFAYGYLESVLRNKSGRLNDSSYSGDQAFTELQKTINQPTQDQIKQQLDPIDLEERNQIRRALESPPFS